MKTNTILLAFIGLVVAGYGVYGYLSGSVYNIPGERGGLFQVTGSGLIFSALSYVVFSLILFLGAVWVERDPSKPKMKSRLSNAMFALFLVGITLQAVGRFA